MVVNKHNGFTLIELLISMAIFAVLASVAYFSLNSLIKQSQIIETADTTLAKLQKTITLIERDFMQLSPRSIRDQSDGIRPALQLLTESAIEFTRAGRPDLGQQQSALVRVKYQYQDNHLIRQSWSALDRASSEQSTDIELIGDVEEFSIQLLGDEGWQSTWPPVAIANPDGDGLDQQVKKLPRAMRIDMKIKDFGEITRLIPGVLR